MTGTRKTVRKLGSDGEWVIEEEFLIDGKVVTEKEWKKAFPDREGIPGMPHPLCWPMQSEALACDPSQVAEMNQRNASKGLSTRYRESDGMAIIPDRNERRKLLKLEKLHDKDGGYGDG